MDAGGFEGNPTFDEGVVMNQISRMKFIGSIILLLSVCLFVAMPYGIGHGLAVHQNKPIIIGVVCGIIGVAMFFMQKRMGSHD